MKEFFGKVKAYLDENNSKVRNITNLVGIIAMFIAGLFFVLFIDLKVRNVASFDVVSGVENINFQINDQVKKIRDSSTTVENDLSAEPTNTITLATQKVGGIAITKVTFVTENDETIEYDLSSLSKIDGEYTKSDVLLEKTELKDVLNSVNNENLITGVTEATNVFRNGGEYAPTANGLLIGNTLNTGKLTFTTSSKIKKVTVNYQLESQTIKEHSFDVSTWLFFAIIFALGSAIFFFIGDSVKHKHKATIALKTCGLVFAIAFIVFLGVYLNEVDLFYTPSAVYPDFIKETKSCMTADVYKLNYDIATFSIIFDVIGLIAFVINYGLSIKYINEDY